MNYDSTIFNGSVEFGDPLFCNDSRCGKRFVASDKDYLDIYCRKLSEVRHLRQKSRQAKNIGNKRLMGEAE